MSDYEQLLSVLIGRKVYLQDGKWHVYDPFGVEISDPDDALLKGLHGWLLWTNAWCGWVVAVNEDQIYHGGGGRYVQDVSYVVRDDSLSVELVRQQWELLELRLRNRQADAAPEPNERTTEVAQAIQAEAAPMADAVFLAMPPVSAMATSIHPATAIQQEQDMARGTTDLARKRRNQGALLLILSQV